MKKNLKITTLLLLALLLTGILLINGCKEDPVVPTMTTLTASDISMSTAKTGGNITSDGGAEIIAKGVCWGTQSQPMISGPHTSDGQGSESFTSNLTGLTPGTTYYVRGFAVNEAGTAYGDEITFKTLSPALPELTTVEVSGITSNAAASGGNISTDGGAAITARGVCWGPDQDPTINQNKTSNGTGSGSFTANLTGLAPATTYHIRAYATNSIGTAYGNDLSFTTLAVAPTLTTTTVTNPTRTTATSGGNITSNGGAAVTARGVCWSTTSGPVATGSHTSDGAGNGTFTSNITGLNPNTLYYVRAYAINSAGTSYGNELSFTTNPASIAILTTTEITGLTTSAAISGGNITEDNGAPVTSRGVCWSMTTNPTTSGSRTTDGAGTGSFISNLTGLSAGTTYYLRAYAINSAGTAYGNQIQFSTSIADREGNVYKTVQIGTQVWMAENLKSTRFNNNTNIPNITDNTAWIQTSSPAYCWMLNDEAAYKNLYGALYNWYAVADGNLCPTGWHVPSDEEFKTLELYLGMSASQIDLWGWRGTNQGAQMKATSGWADSGNGTNSSGFTGLAGGYRYGANGTFSAIGVLTYWWTSAIDVTDAAWYRRLDGANSDIYRASTSVKGGKYVRCLKN